MTEGAWQKVQGGTIRYNQTDRYYKLDPSKRKGGRGEARVIDRGGETKLGDRAGNWKRKSNRTEGTARKGGGCRPGLCGGIAQGRAKRGQGGKRRRE